MVSFGILCIVYYLFIWFYSKRWNSTFALFWPVFGVLNIIWGILIQYLPNHIQMTVGIILAIPWLIFAVVMILIFSAMVVPVTKDLPYIIVLGAQVRGTKITQSLERRLVKALRYLKENPQTKVIVSGGQGKCEDISEADAMAQYLTAHGIHKERIIPEDQSTSTRENLENSARFIKNLNQPVGIVTNNFHMYRAVQIGRQLQYRQIHALPASSNPILFPNYMVREFFGILYTFVFAKRLTKKCVDK